MLGDDLEVVSLKDGKMGNHCLMNCFGDELQKLSGAPFEQIDSDEGHCTGEE